jgi:hypothetical protein
MKRLLLATLVVASVGMAKDPVSFDKGTLVKMESAECGVDSRGAEGIGGVLGVDDSSHTKTRQMLCQEYLLQGDRLVYRIRPTDEKHPALLPIGEKAEYRIEKDRMRLRVPEMDSREREFTVVAVSQRTDADTQTARVEAKTGK